MIRTLSKALSSASTDSPPSSPTRLRRSTLHSLSARFKDSKKVLLEQLPQHQEQFARFRKRAKSLLPSPFIDRLTLEKRNSSDGVRRKKIKRERRDFRRRSISHTFLSLFRSSMSMRSIGAFTRISPPVAINRIYLAFHHPNFFNHRH